MSRFPLPQQQPLVDPNSGAVTHAWNRAFQSLVPQTITVNFGNDIGLPDTDANVYVNQAIAQPTRLDAPQRPTINQTILIVDAKGDAAVNNITFLPQFRTLVNGQPQLVINTNFGWARVVWNGASWSEVGHS